MDWQDEYKRKFVTPEEAVKVIKSGDWVSTPIGQNPQVLLTALYARKDELRDVKIIACAPAFDPGWYGPGHEEVFPTIVDNFGGPIVRDATDAHWTDFAPLLFSQKFKGIDENYEGIDRVRKIDVVILAVTPPNKNGFCCLGPSLWDALDFARRARIVLAEVHGDMTWVHGENCLHVSEIDHFVQGPSSMKWSEVEALLATVESKERRDRMAEYIKRVSSMRYPTTVAALLELSEEELEVRIRQLEPDEETKVMCGYVSGLVRDGDTLQLGVGAPTRLPKLGTFDNKIDLGYHAELVAGSGIGWLVKNGVITGKRKTVNPGVAVTTTWVGFEEEEMDYVAENPRFYLHPSTYTHNIRVIAAHDNFVAINAVISIDLTGQINAETQVGSRIWNGFGGQPEFVIGASLSKGGRSLSLLPSTAAAGKVSRIVPMLDQGAAVTIPRYLADYVVTEYGYTRLWGKPFRQRALDLIGIAHPDFRADLMKEARKMFWET